MPTFKLPMTVDSLRAFGESCSDVELACRAFARFGLSAGARFCQRQGIALEDCLAALRSFDLWKDSQLWIAE